MGDIAIVYMVAGLSSRFGGEIKQFAKVGPQGETLIEYSLNQALPAGFNKIIFIVGNKTEKPFKEMFGNEYKGIPVQYALQNYDPEKRDRPWGTTDAVCSAIDLIDEPFVVCNGDDLYGEKNFKTLIEHLKKNEDESTVGINILKMLPEKGEVTRAEIQINSEGNVTKIKETYGISRSNLTEKNLTEKTLVNMNIFGLHPKTLNMLNEKLKIFKEQNNNDRKIECLIPEELSNLIKENKIQMKLYPFEGKWRGITNPGDEILIRNELKNI